MKEYKVRQKMFYVTHSRLYNKYTKGATRTININSEIHKKLASVVAESKVFANVDDLLTFFIWEYNEKKGLYYYQKMKHFDEIHNLYETLSAWARRIDFLVQNRDEWKKKCSIKQRELSEVKRCLKEKKIKKR